MRTCRHTRRSVENASKLSCSVVCARAGGQQLSVSDVDTAPDELEFEVVEAPVHGELIKSDGSTEVRMTNGNVLHTDAAGRNKLHSFVSVV